MKTVASLPGAVASIPLNKASAPSAMLQQTQHGDHTLNGAKQRLRRVHAARRIELPQRQEIQQQLQNRLGVRPI